MRLFLFLLALTGAGVALAAYVGLRALIAVPGPLPQDTVIYIAPGTSTQKMGEDLAAIQAVDAAWIFRAGAYLTRGNGTLKAGEYLIEDGMSTAAIIRLLQSGKTYQRSITIAEGLMAVEIIALINAAEGLDGDPITDIPAEGSLLPETYAYQRGDQRTEIVTRLQTAMTKKLEEIWATRTPETPVTTREELVTLASIVEKETGVASERPKVAGVFTNRLRLGMPLQSDPTVIYAVTLGREKMTRPISRKDLATPSPYNTYISQGLPPGPIANPGALSLQAVIAPEKHEYLYFVADGTGGHAFGKTLAEHNANVAKWRAIERSQKTSD